MIHERSHEIFTKAIAHFGPIHQMRKCIEELTELSLALQRHLAESSDSSIEAVIDELADVYVTAGQMAILFGGQKLLDRIDFKLKRLEDTMSETFVIEKPTDEQLEHTVTVDVPYTCSWIEQPESVYEKIILDKVPDTPKKVRMPFFDGIGDEYNKVLITQGSLSGSIFSVEPIVIDGESFVNAIELGHTINDFSFYPIVPTWIILRAAEEDKTLVVTRWNRASKSFQDNDSPDFCLQDIYGLRRVEAVDNSKLSVEQIINFMPKMAGLKFLLKDGRMTGDLIIMTSGRGPSSTVLIHPVDSDDEVNKMETFNAQRIFNLFDHEYLKEKMSVVKGVML